MVSVPALLKSAESIKVLYGARADTVMLVGEQETVTLLFALPSGSAEAQPLSSGESVLVSTGNLP
jgi:hypothetical protein